MPIYFITLATAGALAWLSTAPGPASARRAQTPDGARTRIPQFAFLAGAVLALVAALRWRVGTDYWTYERLFSDYVQVNLLEVGPLGEPGLPALAQVAQLIRGDSAATMFALAALLTVGLFVSTLWRCSPAFPLSLALFILLGTWQGSFNGVRQYLAAAIIFAGHSLVLDRRFRPFLLVVAIAALFHVSALVCIALYFVPMRRLRLAAMLLLVVGSVLVITAQGQILEQIGSLRWGPEGVGLSQGSYALETLHPLRVAFAFVPVGLFLVAVNKKRLMEVDHFYVNLLFINAAIYVAASGSAYLARFTIYSSMFLLITIPRLVAAIDEKWRARLGRGNTDPVWDLLVHRHFQGDGACQFPVDIREIVTAVSLTGDVQEGAAVESPPRVLQVAGSMNRGGAETLLMSVFRTMDRSRLQFDFIEFGEESSDYGAEIERLGGRILRMKPPAQLGLRRAMHEYSSLIRQHGPYRAVHAHILHSSALPLMAARRAEVPIRIAHAHIAADRSGAKVRVYQAWARASIRRSATDLVACRPEAGDYLFGASPPAAVRIINNGVDLDTFTQPMESSTRALRSSLSGAPEGLILGCVARLEPVKNHSLLLLLAETMRAQGLGVTLVFIGDGSQRDTLEEEVRQRGLDPVVRFLGVRSDIPELLKALDAVVLPSHREGVPVALVEAQAAGVPCLVSTAVDASVDLGLGLVQFLDVNSTTDWMDAIRSVPRRDEDHPVVTAEARRSALTAAGYDIESVVQEFMSLYQAEHD